MATHTPPTKDEIEALVAEVIRHLRTGTAFGATASAVKEAGSATATVAAVVIGEQVITLAAIERLPAGTTRVTIAPRAVITPSARERAADLRIAIDRGPAPGAVAAPVRPLLVARVDCPRDAAAGAARIARAVPGTQQLPATGMADVLATLTVQASRDAARGILLTGRPAVALILANRSRSLRAVTGRDVAAILAAATDTAANLLVVNPRDFSLGSLERLAIDFVKRKGDVMPAELAAPAAGCGCQGH
ncbi:MAG: hypothetical protein EBR86_05190 [Planctomycetia bacterium]|nr:hypothetical protein [Planctomycetia bacterium]